MRINILTTCTSSGRSPSEEGLNGTEHAGLPTHEAFANYWAGTIDAYKDKDVWQNASTLYQGESYNTALRLKDDLQNKFPEAEVNLCIMSIGFGLIMPQQRIIPYNLSLLYDKERGPSMYRLITEEKFNPVRWWALINKHLNNTTTPIADMVGASDYTLVCSSNTFATMVSEDLYITSHRSDLSLLGITNATMLTKWMRKIHKSGRMLVLNRSTIDDAVPGGKYDFAQRAGRYGVSRLVEGQPISHEAMKAALSDAILIDGIPVGDNADQPKADVFSVVRACMELANDPEAAFDMKECQDHNIPYAEFYRVWNLLNASELTSEDAGAAALDALDSVIDTSVIDDDHSAHELLASLSAALSKRTPVGGTTKMNARNICSWAETFCEMTGRAVPVQFSTPQKFAGWIRKTKNTMFRKEVSPTGAIYNFTRVV